MIACDGFILLARSVLGIPVTYSGHNGKCNICAFHEEIHVFEALWLEFCQIYPSPCLAMLSLYNIFLYLAWAC